MRESVVALENILKKMKDEIERFSKFQEIASGDKKEIRTKDIDVRNYLKYLLKNGSVLEKREVLENIKSKVVLKKKLIFTI